MKLSRALIAPVSFIFTLNFLVAGLLAQETDLVGDHHVTSDGSEAGHLTLDGGISIGGNVIDFGTTGASDSAISWLYSENSGQYTLTLSATRDNASFFWKENAGGTAVNKMKLDADNILSLYDASGNAGLTLSPLTGITLPAGRSLTLSDGTVLSGATSFRQSALYNSSGTAVLQVDSQGKPVFSTEAQFQNGASFGSGGTLDQGKVAYLQNILNNLGYQAQPPSATSVQTIPAVGVEIKSFKRVGSDTYVAGTFSGSGRLGNETLSSWSNVTQGFVAKLNSTNNLVWVYYATGLGNVSISSLDVDSSNNVIVGGKFAIAIYNLVSSSGGTDGFVLKLNSTGQPIWGRSLGGAGEDGILSLAADASGNVIAGGIFNSATTNLGSNNLTGGNYNQMIVKFNASGTLQWAKALEPNNSNSIPLAIDSAGNIFVSALFYSPTTSFGSFNISGWGSRSYLAKFNGSGAVQWAKAPISASNYDSITCLATDNSGNVIAGGVFNGTTSNWGVFNTSGSGGFVLKLNDTGVLQSVRTLGNGTISSVQNDSSGNLIVAGNYQFGTTSLGSYNVPAGGAIFRINSSGAIIEAQSLPVSISSISFASGNIAALGLATETAALGNATIPRGAFIASWPAISVVTPNPLSSASFSWANSKASGFGSVAFGSSAYAGGSNSMAVNSGTSTGQFSFAGGSALSSGIYSAAFGDTTTASGDYSIVAGLDSKASGAFSTAIGLHSFAEGSSSIAVGEFATAKGDASSAFGASTARGYRSASFGYSSAESDYSLSMGVHTIARGSAQLVVGILNEPSELKPIEWYPYGIDVDGGGRPQPTEPLFIIGNGYFDYEVNNEYVRSNAFTVAYNGDTFVAGQLKAEKGAVFNGEVKANGRVRIAPQGDLSMGEFTAEPTP